MEDPQNHMPKRIRSTSKVSIRFLRSRRPTEEDKECPGNAGRDELGRIRFVIHPSERDIDADDPRAVQPAIRWEKRVGQRMGQMRLLEVFFTD